MQVIHAQVPPRARGLVAGVAMAAVLAVALMLVGGREWRPHQRPSKKTAVAPAPQKTTKPTPAPRHTPITIQIDPPRVWLRDPICGRVVDPENAGWTLEVAGQQVYFDSAHCFSYYCKTLRRANPPRRAAVLQPQAEPAPGTVGQPQRQIPQATPPVRVRQKPTPPPDAPSVEEVPTRGDHPEVPGGAPSGPYTNSGGL